MPPSESCSNSVAAALAQLLLPITLPWLVKEIILIILITSSCTRCEKEFNIIPQLLRRQSNVNPDIPLSDALLWFAAEAGARTVKFTACGIFPINYEFFVIYIGFFATNMAILIQALVRFLIDGKVLDDL
ncbi:Hypothetical predicted protein [Cloeon dipterum]|uniref:Uncharacterized protein n=1 Tax=Cloeon dipterum TaxID=197152 RepID=A0A8S1BU97_9INSE|nr:Hypothetical predicted protein [Cloeon dipterum]